MLSGGDKSKLKRLIKAINVKYPEILDILETDNLRNNHRELAKLFSISKDVFKWTSNLSYSQLNNNPIINEAFLKLQDASRTQSLNPRDSIQVNNLIESVEAIYDLQKELIRIVDEDSNLGKNVLKQIMDDLGMEPIKDKSEKRMYSSIDDLFADLED